MRVGFIGLGTMGEDRDSRAFLLPQEERAGVDIKVPADDIKAVMERVG